MTGTEQPEKDNKWGYDLYPERRPQKAPSVADIALASAKGKQLSRLKCEKKVWNCIQKSPLVSLMLSALKSSGCEVDIRRHFACEECDSSVTGGYDTELNQIVICQNMATSSSLINGVLVHELIHMFDYCRNKLDFKNIDHLACTEIRAANLTHCSFMSSMFQGDASFFRIAKQHQECVKTKAIASVVAARNVSDEVAIKAVYKVFNKCYRDLEPIGRRVRRNTYDGYKAYHERFYYGYG